MSDITGMSGVLYLTSTWTERVFFIRGSNPQLSLLYLDYVALCYSSQTILFLFLCTQEANNLFEDINAGLHSMTPERRPHLAGSLLRFNFVELVQKMWQRRLRPQLLEQDGELPQWLRTSLDVISRLYSESHSSLYY